MGTLKRRSRELKSTTRSADDVSANVSSSKEQGSQHKKPKKSTSRVPAPVATPSNFAAHQRHGDRRGRDRDSGDDAPADVLLRAVQVRKRYGDCSDMWIHRRLTDASG